MIKPVNIHEAKTNFSKIVQRVESGEEIIIARSGEPVARLVPVKKKKKNRVLGAAKGKVIIHSSFDDPLPEEIMKGLT